MTIMNGLLDTIANANPNRALLKYFLTMEGPSYICRRYWDWIEPFYIDHVQECSERAHIPAHRYEIELGLKILSNIDKIK